MHAGNSLWLLTELINTFSGGTRSGCSKSLLADLKVMALFAFNFLQAEFLFLCLWWVDLGCWPDPYPAALSFPVLKRTGVGEEKIR